MSERAQLPAGPRAPAAVQTIGWWSRPISFLERARARYGKRFTVRLLGPPPFVMLSEPEQLRELFAAPPDVLHPGEGARILEPVVGQRSVILLDEDAHLEQRKLMLPAFHGEKMRRLAGLMAEVTERELAGWPAAGAMSVHSRLQALTLEIILRAVFGLDPGERLDELRRLLTEMLDFGTSPYSLFPFVEGALQRVGPWAGFFRRRERADQLLFELIEERRAQRGDRDDVLAMLLSARHENGSPMSDQELRDELMTLLVAGHETTASELAWAFERLAREPAVHRRLVRELDGGSGEDYLNATINETLRRRPVLPNAEPRLTKKPVHLGGWDYPPGVCLIANAYLLHHDPDVYPDPYAFRPERFLDEQPGTHTWIPFGGGRRRCLGASFATVEMKIVLGSVLRRFELSPAGGVEVSRRRSITVSPSRGAEVVLTERAGDRGDRPSVDAAPIAAAA